MKKVVTLSESDLMRLVEKVLEEQKGVKVVRCKDIGITDGHMYCNADTKSKIVKIECGALGLTDPNSPGKFGGHRVIKGMCSGKDGKPINEMVSEQKVEDEKVALEKFNKMISQVKSRFCKPWYSSGYQFQIKCNDGTKYRISEFR